MTDGDPMASVVSGARRRARAEAARTKSVWVRLSPVEAAAVSEAAARAGMSVGAWVGETAVGRARADAAGDEPGDAGGMRPSSQRELVAALVVLRAEVAALRRMPEWDSAGSADELLDDKPGCDKPGHDGPAGADRDGVAGVLRRIDAATAVAVDASPSARGSSRADAECSVRP